MMDDSIHILLIEDDPAHAELIRRAFEFRGDSARLTIASTLDEARASIQADTPSLIIADWRLPDGDSHELLNDGHDRSNLPVIIMTSYGNEKRAVEIIKAGALDQPFRIRARRNKAHAIGSHFHCRSRKIRRLTPRDGRADGLIQSPVDPHFGTHEPLHHAPFRVRRPPRVLRRLNLHH